MESDLTPTHRTRRLAEVKPISSSTKMSLDAGQTRSSQRKRRLKREETKRWKKRNKKKKKKRTRPSSIHCSRRYQQTRVTVSARFYYMDPRTSAKLYLNKYNNQTFSDSHQHKTTASIDNIDRFDITSAAGDRLAAAWMGGHVIQVTGNDLDGRQVIGREQGNTRVVLLSNLGGWTSGSKVIAWTRVSVSNRAVSLVDVDARVIKDFQVSQTTPCPHCLSIRPSFTFEINQTPGSLPHASWTNRLTTTLMFADSSSLSLSDVARSDMVWHVVPALTAPGDWQLIISQPDLCPRARDLFSKTFDWLHSDGRLIVYKLRNQTPSLTSPGPKFFTLSTLDPRVVVGFDNPRANQGTTMASGNNNNSALHRYRLGAAGDLRLSNDEGRSRSRLPPSRGENIAPLRLGMYVLLGVFCTALVVFAINCGVMLVVRRSSSSCHAETLSASNLDLGEVSSPSLRDATATAATGTEVDATAIRATPSSSCGGQQPRTLRAENPYALYHRLSTFQRGSSTATSGMRITPNPLHCDSEDELDCEVAIGSEPQGRSISRVEVTNATASSCGSDSSSDCIPSPPLQPVTEQESGCKNNWDYDSMPMSYDQLLTDFFSHIRKRPPTLEPAENSI